jgi:hypothetical protein
MLSFGLSFELHETKRLFLVGMDLRGVDFWELLGKNQTMNGERYKDVLDDRITSWATMNGVSEPIILHNNAQPHKAPPVRDLLETKSWTLLPHPHIPQI